MDKVNFRRSVAAIVKEKFNGDVFAYIENLVETIDTLEQTLENVTNSMMEDVA